MTILRCSDSEYRLIDADTETEKRIIVKGGVIQKPLNYLNILTDIEHEKVMEYIKNYDKN